VKIAQFADRGATPPIVGSEPVQQARFDDKWMWTDAAGRVQPQVTLFDGLFHAENPHLPKLDSAYKALALKMRTRNATVATTRQPSGTHSQRRSYLRVAQRRGKHDQQVTGHHRGNRHCVLAGSACADEG
jgi:hypothetical protein